MDASSIAQVLRRFDPHADTPDQAAETPIFSSGVTDPHVASIAMPVFGAGARLLGALALTGPASRLTSESAAKIAPLLKSSAEVLTHALGGAGH